ncbi:hypothetical protein D3P08_16445 [Paenibacillus nanensis]|uniref:Uncharacterized protein n=1 Tax=Paenibacillus nanensis TaxID=393251 RepID=A0A3A1V1N1_9BACL|nr:hypothetical protein [Paenibacillus nanensis]RIX51500.1 hypothetical protein D3P08_16445 [Paenibacillus nanensis]
MNEHKPDWYDRMKQGPFRERTFTDERMDDILRQARSGTAGRLVKGWHYAAGFAAVLILFFVIYTQQPAWFGSQTNAPAASPDVTLPPVSEPPPTEEPESQVYYVKGETGAYPAPEYHTMEPPAFTVMPGMAVKKKGAAESGFVLIEADGREGYVYEWYLTKDAGERTVQTVEPYVLLVGEPLKFRMHPEEAEPSGFTLHAGKVVKVTKEYEDWVCFDMITYDQPYEGEKWVKRSELAAWDPAKATEGKLRPGADVYEGKMIPAELPADDVIYLKEKLEGQTYQIQSAGGFTGFILYQDFVPNPFLPATASNWLLTPSEVREFEAYSQIKDDEQLRLLKPLDVFQYYVYAQELNDAETVYALYMKDDGYELPDYETYTNDLSRDPAERERTLQLWEKLKMGYSVKEEIDGDEALIRITPVNGGSPEDTKGFRLVRNADGIWKVAWMPMQ